MSVPAALAATCLLLWILCWDEEGWFFKAPLFAMLAFGVIAVVT